MNKKILVSFLGFVLMGSVTAQVVGFPDVSENQWYYSYVMKIKDWNVVNGNEDGTFKPSNNINRAEFSKMIVRYDERVDKKIFDAIEDFKELKKEELNNEEEIRGIVPKDLPVVMHLDRDDYETPNVCPESWTEIAYGRIYEDVQNLNRRTCMIQKSCTSLVLRDRDKIPAVCPENWVEADFGRGRKKEQQRVCYICE